MSNETKVVSMGGSQSNNSNTEKSEQIPVNIQQTNVDIPLDAIDREFVVPTDIVHLPTEGVFYPNKQSVVEYKYMTAEDENILQSTNLLQNGKVLDVLLEKKVIDKNLRPSEMLTADRNAILIAIRISGFGDEYEIDKTCPSCREDFKDIVNLSSLKTKKLKAIPDEKGEFSVFLPIKKVNVKFRLLRGSDEEYLSQLQEKNKKISKGVKISTEMTDQLLLHIMEYNGNRDKIYITRAISAMPPRDSSFLREYISEISPGIDFEKEFNCPNCNHVFTDYIPLTVKLFYPNAKI